MEDAYIINGGKKLKGEIKLSGAKNVALKTIIAALLFEGPVILKNIPRINDVLELLHLIEQIGGKVEFDKENTLLIDGKNLNKNRIDLLYASKIRVSFMFFAPLLHKFGKCFIPNPGGCRLGARSIDRIVKAMEDLGVIVNYDSKTGYYSASIDKKIDGKVFFAKPSHTGTELLIMLSLFCKERVVIENAAQEPEIDEFITFLNMNGAKIEKDENTIIIKPTQKLKQNKPFFIKSDRNEAATYIAMALATKGEVTIGPIEEKSIKTFIEKIKGAGGQVEKINNETWKFKYVKPLKQTNIETMPHPGFMTDWQPAWAVLMTQAQGSTIIKERMFENRFAYVEELRKLGAKIEYVDLKVENPTKYYYFNFDFNKEYKQAIKIYGPKNLHGGAVQISDLRAGATLAIAALMAQGESVVSGASILERGYENFVEKVKSIGGEIKKV